MHEHGIKALTAETISINSCPASEGKLSPPLQRPADNNPTYKPAYSDKYCSCMISTFTSHVRKFPSYPISYCSLLSGISLSLSALASLRNYLWPLFLCRGIAKSKKAVTSLEK